MVTVVERLGSHWIAACLAVIVLSLEPGCDREPRSGADGSALETSQARLNQAFVLFLVPQLTITQAETPVAIPVAPGSRPSPATLRSDDPSIISITPGGQLVAHRTGRTLVRAANQQQLKVTVLEVTQLEVRPAALVLESGALRSLSVVSNEVEVPAGDVSWTTNAPDVAVVSGGELHARATGEALLVARYAGHSAECSVQVSSIDPRDISLRPESPLLHVGQSVAFQLVTKALPPTKFITWTTTSERVLPHLSGGVFMAVSPGSSRVCAATNRNRVCTAVRVEP